MRGIVINPSIGMGDAVQFTSVPENFFRHTGEKLADVTSHWCLDHNPYVIRNVQKVQAVDLWAQHCAKQPLSHGERSVYLTNAESHSRSFEYKIVMNRPRLYKFEEFPFFDRKTVILHVKGKSHGSLPHHVVEHVLKKYGSTVRFVGDPSDWRYSIDPPPFIKTESPWDLANVVSKCSIFVGPDSGPSWVAQCYPDVIVKKVRLTPNVEQLQNWVPLEVCRNSSHWDDRSAFIFNPSDDDAGFTWSYRRI
jgi:hypothetical protein